VVPSCICGRHRHSFCCVDDAASNFKSNGLPSRNTPLDVSLVCLDEFFFSFLFALLRSSVFTVVISLCRLDGG
jgi:hypothetical protein